MKWPASEQPNCQMTSTKWKLILREGKQWQWWRMTSQGTPPGTCSEVSVGWNREGGVSIIWIFFIWFLKSSKNCWKQCCVCISKYYYSISVQFFITFKWDFVGKSTHTDDHTEAGGKAGDQAGAKVTTTLKGSMGERINKALYKVEEKKQKRAARRAQVSIREAGSG